MNEFLPTLVIVLVLALAASRIIRRFGWQERKLLWWSFGAHQAAGIANILVARYYYGYGDMLTYHRHGLVIADRLRSDFWEVAPALVRVIFHSLEPVPVPVEILVSSSGAMQAYAGFSAFFFFGSLYGTCAFIAGLAFLSKIVLYVTARSELPQLPQSALLWSCTLVPSVVFWSSALLKEPIALVGVLFALNGVASLMHARHRARALFATVGGIALVFTVKPYIIPAFGVAAGGWYLAQSLRSRGVDVVFRLWHVLLGGAVGLGAIAVTGVLLPNFALDALGDHLASTQTAQSSIDAGSNYSLGSTSGSAAGQLGLAPLALLTALFRPALFEAKSSLIFVNAIEMTVFTVATLRVPFRRGLRSVVGELFLHPFLSFCFVFTIVFGTFTGLGTTNLGSLSRYRAPLVPFFATLLFALLQRERPKVHAVQPAAIPARSH